MTCDEVDLRQRMGNFTLRLTDSMGFTISSDLLLVEQDYKIGDVTSFKTCDVQIFSNFAG